MPDKVRERLDRARHLLKGWREGKEVLEEELRFVLKIEFIASLMVIFTGVFIKDFGICILGGAGIVIFFLAYRSAKKGGKL